MGIHGLLGQLGPGERISLAKLSSQHFTTHSRPLRLAIDISIWLFQIQSGKGGSNPALRTFYYRLLRLLSLNIHPLFVFDGPNKPLFKRNKKVGGPGVRVASVPEFLAKQLLKQFGFPWHVAPGEAEAECALLQREGIVDAVLSEDVDTLMFGSGVTLRNWSADGGPGKAKHTPTHVSVYRAGETKEKSGMDREGMILVALMSGGDYVPEGIPGVGPKPACDAARAGFGRELCALGRKDADGLKRWKEKLKHEFRTNESKFFTRRKTDFTIPDDFPNREVLGYYTHPCVSTLEKLERLRREVQWDQPIDFAALRTFTADAFDWRCLGGAKKFIKNLAPALLIRELRLRGQRGEQLSQEAQEEHEKEFAQAIHGKRNHATTDGELEYRISFTPSNVVPIDLSIEDEDDEFVPAGGGDVSDVESELMPSTQGAGGDNDSEAPASPKKRNFRPYDPDQPEKLWVLKPFLQIGCPLLVEDFEASFKDPKEFLKARRKARAAAKGDVANIHAAKPIAKKTKARAKEPDIPQNTLMAYAKVTKATSSRDSGRTMKELTLQANARSNPSSQTRNMLEQEDVSADAAFKMPSTQIPAELLREERASVEVEVLNLAASSPPPRERKENRRTIDPTRPFAAFTTAPTKKGKKKQPASTRNEPETPRRVRKRPSPDLSSPAASQRTITSYYSPSTLKTIRHLPTTTIQHKDGGVIDLISSPSQEDRLARPSTPTPPNTRLQFRRTSASAQLEYSPGKLPDTVTKRRRKGPLKRWQTEPVLGLDDEQGEALLPLRTPSSRDATPLEEGLDGVAQDAVVETVSLEITSSPGESDANLPSPSAFLSQRSFERVTGTGAGCEDWDEEDTPKARVKDGLIRGKQLDYAGSGGFMLPEEDTVVTAFDQDPTSSYPTPPVTRDENHGMPPPLPPAPVTATKMPAIEKSKKKTAPNHLPLRRSPRQEMNKKRIHLRQSVEGGWKELDAEMLDMTGDGSGWKKSNGKAKLPVGWRRSGVEVLDLTGA